MAEIYLARQKTELGPARRCVVKQILPELASDPAFSDMLVHEAKLAARLSHANVVQVLRPGSRGRAPLHRDGVRRGVRPQRSAAPVLARQGAAALRARRPRRVRGAQGPRLRAPAHRRRGQAARDRPPRRVAVEPPRLVRRRGEGLRLRHRARERRCSGRQRGLGGARARRGAQGQGRVHEPRARARAKPSTPGPTSSPRASCSGSSRPGAGCTRRRRAATACSSRRAARACPSSRATGSRARTSCERSSRKALAPKREGRYPSAAAMQRDLDGYAAARS